MNPINQNFNADEDSLLVKRAQKGDMDAFETLVTKYEGRVFGCASRMLASGEDAKDAVQDTFLKVYKSLNNFRGESKFSTWLYRITNNVCLDYLRKRDRYLQSLNADFGAEDGDAMETDIPSGINVEAAVEDGEFSGLVRKAVNKLPEQHRIMIILRDMQDLSYTEISKLLGITEGTVKSRINRARKNLRDIFIGFKELKDYIYVK